MNEDGPPRALGFPRFRIVLAVDAIRDKMARLLQP
ncbi:hypothetical protein MPC4_50044 [Methylocella tundrae]|uniref:Uncharacterized protein n=1 Tax=Methylocella tundrae TaxID=227605 RepID=A0A8B6MCJ3_METTU|nr:hypothetical protein MPC1_14090001 [Methylocella tundrae]VTZ51736.1 hypothetical protein MPC4_50044 [Methylocella tundrae]